MHDPMVVAHEILSPWPQIRVRTHGSGKPQGPRWASRWHIGKYDLWFPSLVTVWHVEPDEQDAFTVCKRDGDWKWHVKHWKLQVSPLQKLHRRLITRCSYCMGRSTKATPVNVSHQWDRPDIPWWHPGVDIYHRDCSSKVIRQRTQRAEAETNQKRWEGYRAQIEVLTVMAKDLASIGEDLASKYLTTETSRIRDRIQEEQLAATEEMRAARMKEAVGG